jgi:hypothetical protein
MSRTDWFVGLLVFVVFSLVLVLAVSESTEGGVASEGGAVPDAIINPPGVNFDILLYEVEVNGRTCVVASKSDGIALFCEAR